MQYNRSSAADEAMKNFAKDKAKQVAKKAGKKVGKKVGKKAGEVAKMLTKKLITLLSSILGGISGLSILACILVIFILPSIIMRSAFWPDNDYLDDETVKDSATIAIESRHAQLTSVNFWDDLGTFFGTGHWGTSGETFKTEYAKADDIDEGTGQSVSSKYFGSSNRIIAIIDEAFRSSLRDADGKALRAGRKMAQDAQSEYETRAAADYPKPTYVDDADYHITFTIKKDPGLDEQHFISQACYLLAATSAKLADKDDAEDNTGTKMTLDYAFALTGFEDNPDIPTEICWEGAVTPIIEPVEGSYIIPGETHRYFRKYGADGITIEDQMNASEVYMTEVTTPGYVDDLTDNQGYVYVEEKDDDIEKKTLTVNITAMYTVVLKSNYKTLVNEACGIDDTKAEGETISTKEYVSISALELMKLYGAAVGFAELGEVGLPLPSGSYNITSGFGTRSDPISGESSTHNGVDLAAAAGTPVYAVKDGVCTVPPFNAGGFGNYVYITHTDEDTGEQFVTIYGHMLEPPYVSTGDEVIAGQQIGVVGSTGYSTGPHLHLEMRQPNMAGTKLNPEESTLWPLIEENTRDAVAAAAA